MPDSPSDTPTSHSPRSGRAARLYLALILVCGAVIGIDPIADRILPPPPAMDPALAPTPEIDLFTRFAMGARSLAPSVGGEAFLRQLDDPRRAPSSFSNRDERIGEIAAHLRTAIAVAELTSSDVGLARVEALRPDIDALDPPDPELRTDADAITRVLSGGPGSLSPEERDRLVERHGAIARIALSIGLPDTDPARAPIVRAGVRSVIAVGTIGVLASVGLVVGIGLLITAIVLRASGHLKTRFAPDVTSPPRMHDAFLESVLVFLGGLGVIKIVHILVTVALPDPPAPVRFAMYASYWVIALAALWPRFRGVDRATLARSLGWTRGRGVAREIFGGITSYLAFLPVVCIGFLFLILLVKVLNTRPHHPLIENLPRASPWELVMLYSIAVVWAPIVEETMFRGALYHHLRRFTGAVVSGVFTALIFAAIHPQGITTVPALMALAIGFAACREWRGSLIGSMTGHALHNAALVTLNLALFG